MDDPGISWPFWKFGLKRDDLFTTLQDQYNTFPSSIQDPEAFHHDVFELSHAASTTAEFHSLMSERKQYRLRELNESLESASFEIIANPALIGTDQWQHALQLFRTRSLDSLVRYFASYLPDDHQWRGCDASSSSPSSDSDSVDVDSMAHSEHMDDYLHEKSSDEAYRHFPLSPRSMTMYSASSVASQNDLDHVDFAMTPARTMSFSESEPDLEDSCPPLHHDNPSSNNPSDGEESSPSSSSSVSDPSETHHKLLFAEEEISIVDDEIEYPTSQMAPASETDTPESEIPTPKPKAEPISARVGGGGDSFFPQPTPSRSSLSRSCSVMPRLRHRDSASRMHLSLHAAESELANLSSTISTYSHRYKQHFRQAITPSRLRRRDLSPIGKGSSRPRGTASSNTSGSSSGKVQKSSSEPLRSKPRGRRRDTCC